MSSNTVIQLAQNNLCSMNNSTIYYNLKRSIYKYRRSINVHTEKIRLGFHANLLCTFSSYLEFRFITSPHLDILSAFFQSTTSIYKNLLLLSKIICPKGILHKAKKKSKKEEKKPNS